MKRKFLEDLGLEKEAIDKIMAENGNDVNATKADYDSMKQERDTMAAQVAERDKQLEALKNSTGDIEALKQQIITLQADNQAAKEKYDADMKELKLSTAIKLALGESAQDSDLVAGLFDKSKLILSDDGKVTGLEEQLKALKKEKAFLFKEEKPAQVQIKGGKPVEGAGTPPTDKKPSEMTYSEMCKYLETNPGAAIE
ncbi:MAG: phage scaffolding protein [Clostridiaceae bacterium]|nr:phage scaffolding protein [Clostridiaceae bacterium]